MKKVSWLIRTFLLTFAIITGVFFTSCGVGGKTSGAGSETGDIPANITEAEWQVLLDSLSGYTRGTAVNTYSYPVKKGQEFFVESVPPEVQGKILYDHSGRFMGISTEEGVNGVAFECYFESDIFCEIGFCNATVLDESGAVLSWDPVNRIWNRYEGAIYFGQGFCIEFTADSPEEMNRELGFLQSVKIAFVDESGEQVATLRADVDHYFSLNGNITVPFTEIDGKQELLTTAAGKVRKITGYMYNDPKLLYNDLLSYPSDFEGSLTIRFAEKTEVGMQALPENYKLLKSEKTITCTMNGNFGSGENSGTVWVAASGAQKNAAYDDLYVTIAGILESEVALESAPDQKARVIEMYEQFTIDKTGALVLSALTDGARSTYKIYVNDGRIVKVTSTVYNSGYTVTTEVNVDYTSA